MARNRRAFLRDMVLSFAASTALAKTSIALLDDEPDHDIRDYEWYVDDGDVEYTAIAVFHAENNEVISFQVYDEAAGRWVPGIELGDSISVRIA